MAWIASWRGLCAIVRRVGIWATLGLILLLAAAPTRAQDSRSSSAEEGTVSRMLRGTAGLLYRAAWPTATYDHIEFGRFSPQPDGMDVSAVLHGRSFFDGSDLHVEVVVQVRGGAVSGFGWGDHNGVIPPGATAKATVQLLAEAARQYQASQTASSNSTVVARAPPRPTAPASLPVADSAPAPTTIQRAELLVPVGNMPASYEALYSLGFPQWKDDVVRLLRAAQENDLATFDDASARLRANKQQPEWTADGGARLDFVNRTAQMITDAKTANDRQALKQVIALDEQFLQTHFGYANAQLNLAIAQNALDQVQLAFPPAFHTIVFNPDGANGYLVLGVLLARGGDAAGSTAAFCAALRKAHYSDRTVNYFASIERGEDYPYPGVAAAMRRTGAACPRERWNG